MTGQVRQKTNEINNSIMEDLYEEGLSMTALVAKYGKSESTIHKIKREHDRTYVAEHGHDRPRRKKPEDPRKLHNAKGISFAHLFIGMHIARYRAEHNLGVTEFGMLMSKTGTKITKMERGLYDYSLCDLQRLSEILDIPMTTLVSNEETRAHALA